MKGKKRPEVTARAAQQSWTWSRDAGAREAMGLVSDVRNGLKKRQQFVYDQNGNWVYCIHGIEDMRPRATQNYIKCDQNVTLEHLLRNNKDVMPYCVRQMEIELQRSNDHSNSKRIWDVMRDEEYQNVIEGKSPEPGQAGAFWRALKVKLKEAAERQRLEEESSLGRSDSYDGRRPAHRSVERREGRGMGRSSRSLPPDKLGRYPSTERMRPAYSSSRGDLYMEAGVSDRYSAPMKSMTARESFQRSLSRKEKAPLSTTTRSYTARSSTPSNASLSMTPQSVTNAYVTARRDSRNSDRR